MQTSTAGGAAFRVRLGIINGVALLLLAGMSDLETTTRLAVAAVIALNLLLLFGTSALATGAARVGAKVSFAGYILTVATWLVLALGCGIEYYNARCDAVVQPLIFVCAVIAVVSFPLGRAIGVVYKPRSITQS